MGEALAKMTASSLAESKSPCSRPGGAGGEHCPAPAGGPRVGSPRPDLLEARSQEHLALRRPGGRRVADVLHDSPKEPAGLGPGSPPLRSPAPGAMEGANPS